MVTVWPKTPTWISNEKVAPGACKPSQRRLFTLSCVRALRQPVPSCACSSVIKRPASGCEQQERTHTSSLYVQAFYNMQTLQRSHCGRLAASRARPVAVPRHHVVAVNAHKPKVQVAVVSTRLNAAAEWTTCRQPRPAKRSKLLAPNPFDCNMNFHARAVAKVGNWY